MLSFRLLLMLGIVLVGQGVFYWAYRSFREMCLNDAVCGFRFEPAKLFLHTFCFGIVYCIAIVPLILIGCMAFPVLLLAIPYGLVGWYRMIRAIPIERAERRAILSQHPIPRLQFRITDLWVATLVVGMLLMLLTQYYFHPWYPYENAAVIVYALVAETASFLIAMDVCRRSNVLQKPLQRYGFTTLVMLLGIVPQLFVLLFLTWRAWRYAMWKSLPPEIWVDVPVQQDARHDRLFKAHV